ncbi:hypothetical protein M758_3G251500 [Ceratodon purpureus]|nr:hypothetical protein M758_3G251500 [Ceratodon purpureus]
MISTIFQADGWMISLCRVNQLEIIMLLTETGKDWCWRRWLAKFVEIHNLERETPEASTAGASSPLPSPLPLPPHHLRLSFYGYQTSRATILPSEIPTSPDSVLNSTTPITLLLSTQVEFLNNLLLLNLQK